MLEMEKQMMKWRKMSRDLAPAVVDEVGERSDGGERLWIVDHSQDILLFSERIKMKRSRRGRLTAFFIMNSMHSALTL